MDVTETDLQNLKPFVDISILHSPVVATTEYKVVKSAEDQKKTGKKFSTKTSRTTKSMQYTRLSGENFISAEITGNIAEVANQATFKFFDREFSKFRMLLQQTTGVVYRFGWLTSTGKELMSKPKYGNIFSWEINMSGDGIEHTISVSGVGIKYNSHPRLEVHTEKRISDIAKKIADRNDWASDILVTKIIDNNEHKTKNNGKNKGITQRNLSDMQFLNYLTRFAVAESIDDAYVCFLDEEFDEKTKEVHKTLVFKPIELKTKYPSRIYTMFRTNKAINPKQFIEGSIKVENPAISYSPRYQPYSSVDPQSMGAVTSSQITMSDSGEVVIQQIATGEQTIKNTDTNKTIVPDDPNKAPENIITLTTISSSPALDENALKVMKARMFRGILQADLEVIGDYNVHVPTTIFIRVIDPVTKELLPVSNFYTAIAVSHVLTAGEYTSKLRLTSMGAHFGDVESFNDKLQKPYGESK